MSTNKLGRIPANPIHPMPFTRIELAIMSIIDGQLVVLLGKRAQAPHQGKWALPGGVLRIDKDIHLDAAAQRVGKERLEIEIDLPHLRQVKAVGSKSRDSRSAWALSIVYRALIPLGKFSPSPGKRLDELKWFTATEAVADKKLAFDHADLIRLAVETTQSEIENLDLPFDFLPEAFTLGELQTFCEAVLGRRLDKSSFRRRLAERSLLEPVQGEMRTGGAHRPAQLYQKR